MKKTILILTIISLLCLSYTVSSFPVGNDFYTGAYDILSQYDGVTKVQKEYQRGIPISFPSEGYVDYIKCYLKVTNSNVAKCCIYETGSTPELKATTEEKLITSTTGAWYQFNFSSYVTINHSKAYFVSVYGNATTSGSTTNYIWLSYTQSTGLYFAYRLSESYPEFARYISDYTASTNKGYAIYCNFTSIAPPQALDSSVYMGWRMVSTPSFTNISRSDIRLLNETENYTWNEAVSEGIIIDWLIGWNETLSNGHGGYDYWENNYFEPYKGYWVFFYDKNYSFWIENTSNGSIFDGNSSELWLYLGSTVTLDNFTILISYLFIVLYFIYNKKTNEVFVSSYGSAIFIMTTLILLFGVQIGEFITDLGLSDFQRALLLPFIPIYISLLWLRVKKP